MAKHSLILENLHFVSLLVDSITFFQVNAYSLLGFLRLGYLCQSLISFAMEVVIVSVSPLKHSGPLFIKRAPF